MVSGTFHAFEYVVVSPSRCPTDIADAGMYSSPTGEAEDVECSSDEMLSIHDHHYKASKGKMFLKVLLH